jgi:hypothetical protein
MYTFKYEGKVPWLYSVGEGECGVWWSFVIGKAALFMVRVQDDRKSG